MKFIYKLEPIKKIKNIMEKKVQEELFQIEEEILLHQDILNSICIKRENFLNEEQKNISSSELKYKREYINDLNSQIAAETAALKELEILKRAKKEELVKISKEKKIHEKLEEIHFNLFKEKEKKIESDFINELAVQGYARKTKF